MLASHPMCWKEILHYSIETSFPEWMIQWLTALPRMYLGKNPLYGGWTDVKPCMIKCWIVRKVPQTRILVGDVETGCISNFPTLQAVQEPPCHGGRGTHMGHLMIDQYQGSGRGRGPTCDLIGRTHEEWDPITSKSKRREWYWTELGSVQKLQRWVLLRLWKFWELCKSPDFL